MYTAISFLCLSVMIMAVSAIFHYTDHEKHNKENECTIYPVLIGECNTTLTTNIK